VVAEKPLRARTSVKNIMMRLKKESLSVLGSACVPCVAAENPLRARSSAKKILMHVTRDGRRNVLMGCVHRALAKPKQFQARQNVKNTLMHRTPARLRHEPESLLEYV